MITVNECFHSVEKQTFIIFHHHIKFPYRFICYMFAFMARIWTEQ